MHNFKTYKNLTDIVLAKEIAKILETHKIVHKILDTSNDFDATFSLDDTKNSILILLDSKDFDHADKLIDENLNFDINQFSSQHPFFSFTKEELIEVVKNFDDWSPLDVKLANHLLKEQNVTINQTEIKTHQVKKIRNEETPQKSKAITLLFGYLFSLLGGFLGLGIALFLVFGKRTLSDGSKKYIYCESDRKHGIYMLFISISIIMLAIYYNNESQIY